MNATHVWDRMVEDNSQHQPRRFSRSRTSGRFGDQDFVPDLIDTAAVVTCRQSPQGRSDRRLVPGLDGLGVLPGVSGGQVGADEDTETPPRGLAGGPTLNQWVAFLPDKSCQAPLTKSIIGFGRLAG